MDRLPGNWHGYANLEGVAYRCGFCSADVGPNKCYHIQESANIGHIRICTVCNRPTFFDNKNVQHPGVPFGQAVGNLPRQIESLYTEARNCSSAGAYTAAVLACRKILMHIAVDQGSEKGLAFIDYVDYLAAKGFVPPHGKTWVDHIRKKSNEANHEIVLMNQNDAQELITFLEMLLKFIYEFPARVPKPTP